MKHVCFCCDLLHLSIFAFKTLLGFWNFQLVGTLHSTADRRTSVQLTANHQ